MSKIYFGSDFHFGHFNVIEYCRRPWKTVEEMNDAMVEIINKTVKEDDTFYILGDISLNPKWMEFLMERIICKTVYLIVGNHDSCFEKKLGAKPEKTAKMRERYFKAGIKDIRTELWITLKKPGILGSKIKEKLYHVQLCHFPFAPKPDTINNGDIRYLSNRPIDKGQILLHGHSHSFHRKNGRMIDVGFDGDLKIFSEQDIITLIEDEREYIPSPITEYYNSRKESLIKKDEY